MVEEGWKRDVLFVYDILLQPDFQPTPQVRSKLHAQEVLSMPHLDDASDCAVRHESSAKVVGHCKRRDGGVPPAQDGEVEAFELKPIGEVARLVSETQEFKPNCALVIIDFMIRHGVITPEQPGYAKLVANMRLGDCS